MDGKASMESTIVRRQCETCYGLNNDAFKKQTIGLVIRKMAALRDSADRGCSTCKLVVEVLLHHVSEMESSSMAERTMNLTIPDHVHLRIFPPIEASRHLWAATAGLDILGFRGK